MADAKDAEAALVRFDLGASVNDGQGAKYWLAVLAEIKNRGVRAC